MVAPSRLAVSGAHRTGKSTLIAELKLCLASHDVVDELYFELLAEGHEFAGVPDAEDFEMMLERSIDRITYVESPRVVYDRCPVDYLAYLAALGKKRLVGDWIPRVTEAIAILDLIVFVPIEQPDRIDDVQRGTARLRRDVDRLLREMLVEDGWGLGARVLEVSGSPSERAAQVVA